MYRRIYNHATDVEICPLNEEKAVQADVDLIGELLVFTVQRSARSEARKEELRKKELEVVRHRNEALALEVELLKNKLQTLEQLARERGLDSVNNFRQVNAENAKTIKAA